jgi:FixJ family two-component response regulator
MAVSLPIVYLTGHADVPMSVDAMKKGALDILLKPAEDEAVLRAVGAALAKHEAIVAQDTHRGEIEARLARLSAREREVMEYVIGGRLNKQIAGDLGISEKTVKAHRARVMEKLETRSVAALTRMCEVVGIKPRQAALSITLRPLDSRALCGVPSE